MTDLIALTAAGVSGADDITVFKFFTNDFDTETSGFDHCYVHQH